MELKDINLDFLHIPLEDNQELLIEYGRAVGWINMVEFIVENLIRFKGRPPQTNLETTKDALANKTLGQKIPLLEKIIDPSTIDKIKELNRKRIILAHGVAGVLVKNKDGKTTNIGFTIEHQGVEHTLTPEFLKEITRECKEVTLLLS